ncbi:MAG TPA: preprotein translocase subunit SecG [Gammaproteobacteria bacterium]|nr:preprotein translocase subunit SecG [Gammaproteobacteria bacterium]
MLYTILIIVEVFVSIALTLLILLQQGKGADAGAAFGSGASGTVFGARGSGSFLSKATVALAAIFMANSTAMAYLSHQVKAPTSVVERAAAGNATQAPDNAPGTPTGKPETGPAPTEKPASQPAHRPAQNKQPPAAGSSTDNGQGD